MDNQAGNVSARVSGVGILVIVFVVVGRLVERFGELPDSAYLAPAIALSLARRLLEFDLASIGVICLLVLTAAGLGLNQSAFPRWTDFEHGARLRLFALIVVGLLAWYFSTYATNLYFDRAHVLDRLALILLVPVVYWRPIALFPFLLLLMGIMHQFAHPIGQWGWTEPSLLARILVVVLSLTWIGAARRFLARHIVLPEVNTGCFLFVAVCLIASYYWTAGFGKIELGWLAVDRIDYLLPATYSAGWLSFLDGETIVRAAQGIAAVNIPLKLLTLVLEGGAIFVLVRRGVTRAFLIGWMLFHTGIFFASGIFFWRWIIVEAVLFLTFFGRGAPDFGIHRPALQIVAVALIVGGGLWSRPTTLAWIDAPANYAYRVTAVDSDGRHLRLPPRFFEPYDYQFTVANFGTIVPDTLLGITFGAAGSSEVVAALERATSRDDLVDLEHRLGKSRFSARHRDRIELFLKRHCSAWNRRRTADPSFGSRPLWSRALAAPRHLWTFPSEAGLPRGAIIDSVYVNQVFAFYDGMRYQEIRERRVLTVDVD